MQNNPSEKLYWMGIAMFKLENLVREMQDAVNGVPIRTAKHFLTSIPAAFMGRSSFLQFPHKI